MAHPVEALEYSEVVLNDLVHLLAIYVAPAAVLVEEELEVMDEVISALLSASKVVSALGPVHLVAVISSSWDVAYCRCVDRKAVLPVGLTVVAEPLLDIFAAPIV